MKKIVFFFILATFPILGKSQEYKHVNSVEEQMEDFNIFKTTILECHAGIYDYNDSLSLFSHLGSMKATFSSKQLTQIEVLAIYNKFITSLGCIHSYVYHKKMLPNTIDSKYTLPFKVYFFNNQLKARENFNSKEISIDKNDQILSINGESISNLKDSLYQFISSDGNTIRRKNNCLENYFLYYYFLYKNNERDFTLEYVNRDDTLQSLVKSVFHQYSKNSKPQETSSLKFSIDTLGKYALVTLPYPLPLNKKYKEELASLMSNIRDLEIQNLIVDLRNNGGGRFQTYFSGFFIDSAILDNTKTFKALHEATYKKYFIHKMNIQYIISNLAARFEYSVSDEFVEPQIQYNGNLFVLVNSGTASAASNLASSLKEWGDATIVGEETGGGYKSFNTGGAILKLPNSKMRIAIRSVHGVNNTRHVYESFGVTPHFEVLETDYFRKKGDEQLNYILNNLIESKSR